MAFKKKLFLVFGSRQGWEAASRELPSWGSLAYLKEIKVRLL